MNIPIDITSPGDTRIDQYGDTKLAHSDNFPYDNSVSIQMNYRKRDVSFNFGCLKAFEDMQLYLTR